MADESPVDAAKAILSYMAETDMIGFMEADALLEKTWKQNESLHRHAQELYEVTGKQEVRQTLCLLLASELYLSDRKQEIGKSIKELLTAPNLNVRPDQSQRLLVAVAKNCARQTVEAIAAESPNSHISQQANWILEHWSNDMTQLGSDGG